MSIKLVGMVLDAPMSNPLEKLALIVLANYANDRAECWPAVETVAFQCGVQKRSAQRILRRLEKDGYTSILSNKGPRGTNLYLINSDRLEGGGDRNDRGATREATGGDRGSHLGATRESSEPSRDPLKDPIDLFGEEKSDTKSKPDIDKFFDEFWELYPKNQRKAAKVKCREMFRKTVDGTRKDLEEVPSPIILVNALKAYIATNPELQYVPAPLVWLRGCKFEAFLPGPGDDGGGQPMTDEERRYHEIIARSGKA